MKIPSVFNTSNAKKQLELKRLFAVYNHPLQFTEIPILEIDAPPLQVILHKISVVGLSILVEDTSLHVEGYDVGVNVKHMTEKIENGEWLGKKAVWQVLIGFADQAGMSYVFEGVTEGVLTHKAGDFVFGFAQYFKPIGQSQTMGQNRDDALNARARAVAALFKNYVLFRGPTEHNFSKYRFQKF